MTQGPLLLAPPRPISARTRLELLLGGWVSQTGWVVVTLGSVALVVLALVFGTDRVVFPIFGPAAQATGTVTRCHRSGANVFADKNEDSALSHTVDYAFAAVDGKRYTGQSVVQVQRSDKARPVYSTTPAFAKVPAVGDELEVEYLPTDPSVSRLVRSKGSDIAAIFLVMIFPLVGLIVAAIGSLGGLRRLGLLKHGVVTDAPLMGKYPSSFAGTFYRDFLLSLPDGSSYQGMVRIQDVDDPEDPARKIRQVMVVPKHIMNTVRRKDPPAPMEEGPTVRVIHPPRKPAKVMLLVDLPELPRTNDQGLLELPGLGSRLKVLAAPALGLLSLALPAAWLALRLAG